MNDKYYCRTCKGKRFYKVVAEKKTRGSEETDFFAWNDDYYIIQCLGCETVSFLQIYGDSEMHSYDEEGNPGYYDDETIYPTIVEDLRELESLFYTPLPIRKIYKETVEAFKAGAFILTAGGLRAVIESTCNHLKIKREDLSKRIDLLFEKGFLSLKESRRLHSIRFLGNDALHEIETPPKEKLLILFEIVNHLLENLFVHDKKMESNIDVMVDSYDRFVFLVSNKISKDLLAKELTIPQILGKSKRLIKPVDLKKFELQLIKDIASKKVDFMSIVKEEIPTIYKIEKVSKFFLFDE